MNIQFRTIKVRFFVLMFLLVAGAEAGVPPTGLYENSSASPLVAVIDSANKLLDIEIYQMDSPLVQKAILNAQSAGVKVRIIQEPNPVGDPCKIFEPLTAIDPPDCAALKAFRGNVLRNGGIYVPFNKMLCGGANGGCVQHGKMVIADANTALLSTGNFNSTSLCDKRYNPSYCDRDYTYVIHSPPAIQALGTIFERDLAGAPYDLQPILARQGAATLTVSPFSMNPLVQFIHSAKSNLVIQEQYLKDPEMNAAIMDAVKRGLQVRIMIASVCFFSGPSPWEADQFKATYSALENAGAVIRTFTRQIPVGGMPGYLHTKAIVVDGSSAWVGSVNGSTQSITANREFGIFFNTPNDIAKLLGVMKSDFNNPGSESWQESIDCKKDKS